MPFSDKNLPCAKSTYRCYKCDRSFSGKESFVQHLQNSKRHKAAYEPCNCLQCVRSFSNKSALIQHLQKNRSHSNDLHFAACTGKYHATGTFLVNQNADRPGESHLPSSRAQTGFSPMHCAAFGGHYECLKIMLCWPDGDPNVADPDDGKTPVHLAAWKGHANCLKLLLGNGGDLRARDVRGNTPLTLVKDTHCFTVVMYHLAGKTVRSNTSYESLGESLKQEIYSLCGRSTSGLFSLFAQSAVVRESEVGSPFEGTEIEIIPEVSSGEPYAVLARGEVAVDLFNQALREGKATVSQMQLAVIGNVGAGKTSLVRTLSGQDFLREREETHGIDTSMVETTELDESWHAADLKKSHVDEILAEIVCRGVKISRGPNHRDSSSSDESPGRPRGYLARLRSIECAPVAENADRSEKEEGCAVASANAAGNAAITRPGPQTPQREMPVDQIIRRLSEASLEDKDRKYGKITIWDFAGHPLYRTMHHVFLNRRSFYLVVFNLKQFCDPKTTEEEVKHIRFWLNSVRVHTPHTTPIFLVGTHRDSISQEDINQAEKQTRHEFAEVFGQQLVQSKENCFLFTVENSLGSEDDGAVSLMKAVEREACQLMRNEEELPIRWLHFEEQIVKYRKQADHQAWVAKDFLWKIMMADQFREVDEREFYSMLQFYHDSGVIILPEAMVGPRTEYHSVNDLVVVDPQYLVDVMTSLHDIPDSVDVNRQFRTQWNNLQEQGIADLGLLEHAWQSFQSPTEELVGILEATGMICPLQPHLNTEGCDSPGQVASETEQLECGTKNFIVPIHLKEKCLRRRWERLCRKTWTGICTSNKILIFDFHSFLPPAVFPYLIVRTAAESKRTSGMDPVISKFMGIFSFADNFFVMLELHQKYNQIQVSARNRNGKALPELFYSLKTIMTDICQQHFKFLKFVLGPACPNPQCPGSSADGKALPVSSSSEDSDCEDDGINAVNSASNEERRHVICVDPMCFTKPLWCNSTPVHEFEEIKQWLEKPQKSVAASVSNSCSLMQVQQCCLILVAKALANHWKWLGRSLGVSETTINTILKENIESQDEQSYQVLDRWLTKNGSNATVNTLMKALETVGVAEALEEFARHLAESHFVEQ